MKGEEPHQKKNKQLIELHQSSKLAQIKGSQQAEKPLEDYANKILNLKLKVNNKNLPV